MALLLRFSRSSRNLKPFHHHLSLSLSQSISPNLTNPNSPPNPNSSHYQYDQFPNSNRRTQEQSIPNFSNFKFRYFNLFKLGQNYGISTSSHRLKEEDDKLKRKNDDKTGCNVSWIDLYLPKSVRAYAHLARLDKPIGTWLLAWPCMW